MVLATTCNVKLLCLVKYVVEKREGVLSIIFRWSLTQPTVHHGVCAGIRWASTAALFAMQTCHRGRSISYLNAHTLLRSEPTNNIVRMQIPQAYGIKLFFLHQECEGLNKMFYFTVIYFETDAIIGDSSPLAQSQRGPWCYTRGNDSIGIRKVDVPTDIDSLNCLPAFKDLSAPFTIFLASFTSHCSYPADHL